MRDGTLRGDPGRRVAAVDFPRPPATLAEALLHCRDPLRLLFHTRHVTKRVAFVATLTGQTTDRAREAIAEIGHDTTFLTELQGRHLDILGRQPRATDLMYLATSAGSPFFFLLAEYALARLLAPALIVETGGTPGNSSAFLLRALERNGAGQLVTVDLPPKGTLQEFSGPPGELWHSAMPDDQTSGWAIPPHLRARQRLEQGDAREVLPPLLSEVAPLDIFRHDSDHSYSHMLWEFEQAWPYIRPGGLLLCDDILSNNAFVDFGRRTGRPVHRLGALGGIVKPVG